MYSGLSKVAIVESLKRSYYEDAGDVDSAVNLGHFSSSSISLRQQDTCSSASFIFLAVALSSFFLEHAWTRISLRVQE
jgi:hypothetical protein